MTGRRCKLDINEKVHEIVYTYHTFEMSPVVINSFSRESKLKRTVVPTIKVFKLNFWQ